MIPIPFLSKALGIGCIGLSLALGVQTWRLSAEKGSHQSTRRALDNALVQLGTIRERMAQWEANARACTDGVTALEGHTALIAQNTTTAAQEARAMRSAVERDVGKLEVLTGKMRAYVALPKDASCETRLARTGEILKSANATVKF